jgi:hypothetical protein
MSTVTLCAIEQSSKVLLLPQYGGLGIGENVRPHYIDVWRTVQPSVEFHGSEDLSTHSETHDSDDRHLQHSTIPVLG